MYVGDRHVRRWMILIMRSCQAVYAYMVYSTGVCTVTASHCIDSGASSVLAAAWKYRYSYWRLTLWHMVTSFFCDKNRHTLGTDEGEYPQHCYRLLCHKSHRAHSSPCNSNLINRMSSQACTQRLPCSNDKQLLVGCCYVLSILLFLSWHYD